MKKVNMLAAIALVGIGCASINLSTAKADTIPNVTSSEVKPTVISKNSVIKIKYNGLGGVAVWSNYDSSKKITGQYLKNATRLQSFKQVTVDGTTWYNLGGDQWVSGQYVENGNTQTASSQKPESKPTIPETKPADNANYTISPFSGTIKIKYDGLGGVAVWSNYDSSKKLQDNI